MEGEGGGSVRLKYVKREKVLEIIKRIIIKKEIEIYVQLHVEVEIWGFLYMVGSTHI